MSGSYGVSKLIPVANRDFGPATTRVDGGISTPRMLEDVCMTLRASFGSKTRQNGHFCRSAIFLHWRGTGIFNFSKKQPKMSACSLAWPWVIMG